MKELIMLPVMGAAIGYGTNWLAIKMVFRPYEEKRIFNIKVPFTPGVMAKERYVFSKKLGDTLSANIITEEELVKYFQKIDFGSIFNDLIKDINVDDTLLTFIKSPETVQAINNDVKDFVVNGIDENDRKYLANTITEEILQNFKEDSLYNIVSKEEVVEFINSFKNNDELFRIVNNIISKTYRNDKFLNKAVDELLGQTLKENILNSVNANGDNIRIACLNYVDSDKFEFFEEKIYSLIVSGINKIPLASMFGGEALGKMIMPILKENIIEYLDDEENNDEIANVVCKILRDLFEEKMGKMLGFITHEMMFGVTQKAIVEICNSLATYVKTQDLDNEFCNIFKGFTSIIEPKMNNIILDIINNTLSDDKNLDRLSKALVDKVLNIKISGFINNMDNNLKNRIFETLQSLFNNNATKLIEQLNISEIVEEKINTFEMQEAENLVVGVMNKELKMITTLGGVLGFVVGCITALI